MKDTNTALPASAFVEQIERNLPEQNRSRIALIRTLLLLLRVRNLPDFLTIALKVLEQLEESISWPSPIARFELGNIVVCFSEFDDRTVTAIREGLQKLLSAVTPDYLLGTSLASALGATYTDTDRIAAAGNDVELVKPMLSIALHVSIYAVEDFTLKVGKCVEDANIREAIRTFYANHGFKATYECCGIRAENDHLKLWAEFSNHSFDDGHILVTVNEIE